MTASSSLFQLGNASAFLSGVTEGDVTFSLNEIKKIEMQLTQTGTFRQAKIRAATIDTDIKAPILGVLPQDPSKT